MSSSGLVSPEDIYVICLNAGSVDEAAWVDHPLITYLERSVFSFGPEQTHISLETGDVTGHSFAHKPTVFKQNQSAVGTDLFFSTDSAAVMWSNH